jgi:alkanesulfonate monooxygenase SsuD/methylene tetrahydromethanopterin reductase-like flavin-dependent oxidoreductase (luciferase family)
VLTAYSSGSPDPAQAAALIATNTERLQLLLAHRPNVSYPTFAAKTVATLDQISDGRLTLDVRGRHTARGPALRPHPRGHTDLQEIPLVRAEVARRDAEEARTAVPA